MFEKRKTQTFYLLAEILKKAKCILHIFPKREEKIPVYVRKKTDVTFNAYPKGV